MGLENASENLVTLSKYARLPEAFLNGSLPESQAQPMGYWEMMVPKPRSAASAPSRVVTAAIVA